MVSRCVIWHWCTALLVHCARGVGILTQGEERIDERAVHPWAVVDALPMLPSVMLAVASHQPTSLVLLMAYVILLPPRANLLCAVP